jgi:hypothetical protein
LDPGGRLVGGHHFRRPDELEHQPAQHVAAEPFDYPGAPGRRTGPVRTLITRKLNRQPWIRLDFL